MITKFNYKDRTIKSYAIRKLTPFECFRLMGVRDAVIHIMQSVHTRLKGVRNKLTGKKEKVEVEEMIISASQQYKQAGNSIVVDVLKAIYNQLWYPEGAKVVKSGDQLELFNECTFDGELPDAPIDNHYGVKKILTTFSGYDSQLMAADALKEDHPNFQWECVGWSDIDAAACTMHNIVFPQYADKALGDITKIDWHKVKESLNGDDIDLFTYSSPCQDISQAGKQMGLKEGSGSRSALLWYVSDAVEILKPKYLLQENVAALVSKKFMPDFQLWLDRLESLGYVNVWARLNAKNFNVPQNRDRVFCLSMRKDVAFKYKFPQEVELTRKLEDILEEEVDERYFLKDDAVGKFLKANDKDSAVFVQFNLPPRHEDAMFLKTYLTRFMESRGGWEMKPTELETAITVLRDTSFPKDWRNSLEMKDESFLEEYYTNLNKQKDAECN